MDHRGVLFALLALAAHCCIATGCNGSRWAKRDADYRQKYPRHTSSVPRTIKQAIDARYVRGKSGGYIAAAGRDDPIAAGAEVGLFGYSEPWLEVRGGLAGLIHETGERPLSGGMLGSVRLQAPSRVAPFVGLGIYGGWAGLESAENDNVDNDDNGFVDEDGETESDFAVAIFPEVGAHVWLNHRVRLTTSVNYYVTNQGRDDDFLFYSVGLSFFGSQYEARPHAPPVDCGDSVDWEYTAPDIPLQQPYKVESYQSKSPYTELTLAGYTPRVKPTDNKTPPTIYPSTALPVSEAEPADEQPETFLSPEIHDESLWQELL